MQFSVLGPLRIESAGVEVVVSAPRQRSLLALFLVHPNTVLSADRIIDELWGAKAPASGVKTLQYHISKLRESLGDGAGLVTRPPGYLLEVARSDLDVFRFEDLAVTGGAQLETQPASAAKTLSRALELWRGPPFSDFTYEPFAAAEINRLEQLHRSVVADRIQADLATGRQGDLITELETLVAAHPLDERFRGQLMTALYRAGRQADALQSYQEARKLLGEELGIDPSSALQALEEQILLQAPELASPTRQHETDNLPRYISDFVGRTSELASISGLVAEHRLVTLIGLGGIGKTRTAVEVALGQTEAHRHGTVMVDLSAVTDPAATARAFADALGVRAGGNGSLEDALIGYLRRKDLLLLVDNCEQVLEAAAGLVQRLLEHAPSLTILATSIEPLGVPGEVAYRVPPLAVSASGPGEPLPDALQLFVDRAVRRQSDRSLSEAFYATALRICEQLDGIPLAIELAAARTRVMSIEELEKALTDRFAILTGGDRTTVLRHRTLQATLDWSYELLEFEEQLLLRRLAVFRGGFDLPAVLGCTDGLTVRPPLDLLTRLCDTSMVLAGEATAGRYHMLETVREYADEKLVESGEAGMAARRHAGHFRRLAGELSRGTVRGDQSTGWARLKAEEANIQSAIEWALDEDEAELALGIAADMGDFWFHNSDHAVARRTLARALDAAVDPDRTDLFSVLSHLSRFANWAGRIDEADTFIERQRTVAESSGDRLALAQSLGAQGAVAWSRGRYRRARHLLVQAIGELDEASAAEAGRWLGQVSALSSWMGDLEAAERYVKEMERLRSGGDGPMLEARIADARGTLSLQRGHLDAAADDFGSARRLFADLGLEVYVLDMLQSEATILIDLARYDEAEPVIDRALASARAIGDRRFGARGILLQGRVASAKGDFDSARQRLRASLRMSHSAGDRPGVMWAVLALATQAALDGDPEAVLRLHGIGEAIRLELEVELPEAARDRAVGEMTGARSRLSENRADDVWEEAVSAGYPAAVALGEASASPPASSSRDRMA